ncbi:MAG: serine/threonine protein kinase [Deltaproteobacteria bacterium]|nr:serine/threonine protein kinase [Deltaproteobacteria bacterium]
MSEQFFSLTPDLILDVVERAALVRATGRTLALNSMENRVYELELEDGSRIVTKFYRPGRWTAEQILEEHAFVADLAANEVPAVAPLPLSNGSTLERSDDGIFFAVFPKTRGRILQELDDSRLQQVGRLLGRLHNVGAAKKAAHRLALTPDTYGWRSLELLASSPLLDAQAGPRYRAAAERVLRACEAVFTRVAARQLRLHGDCHLGNVLWQDTGPFFLDFDDMVTGPAVQDVWLVVRGRDEEAQRSREVLLRSYETMREFDRSELALIEPLRALRIIHYSAWIARRWEDPTFRHAFPDFGSQRYWFEELATLEEQADLITGT